MRRPLIEVRMLGDLDMQRFTAGLADHEEGIERLEQ
jgi:hypothetical protein